MVVWLILLVASTLGACDADQSRLLRQSEQAFDQDVNGGWRELGNRGCYSVAADLIHLYRQKHRSTHPVDLIWHEAQMRANAEQTEQALELFRKSYRRSDPGWNIYVDGTVAFLEKDRGKLMASRDALVKLPKPKHQTTFEAMGHVYPVPWPPNLNVLEGLLKCFDKTYRDAYNSCVEPIFKVEVPET